MRVICIILFFFSGLCRAEADVNLSELATELSRTNIEDTSIQIVFWMPMVYWEAMASNFSAISEANIQQILLILEPYEIFAVVDAEMDLAGSSFIGRSYESVVRNTSLKVNDREPFKALSKPEISEKLQQVLELMRPGMVRMMGQMGSSMHLIVFDLGTTENILRIDPGKSGKFYLQVYERKFFWRLPLGSLLPPRYDPDTLEKFPGNFIYSPYTGNELTEKADSAISEE